MNRAYSKPLKKRLDKKNFIIAKPAGPSLLKTNTLRIMKFIIKTTTSPKAKELDSVMPKISWSVTVIVVTIK